MREANRKAFIRIVSADPGVDVLDTFKFGSHAPDAVRQLREDAIDEVAATFQRVGGRGEMTRERLEELAKQPRTDDHLRIDGQPFVVEYDEVLHFNVFRGATLESAFYQRLRVGFHPQDYLPVCGTRRMTGGSKRAHSPGAHRDFVCLVTPGECRHRQRAFYDFLKDVLFGSGFNGMPGIIRISDLTDFIGGKSPGQIIEAGTSAEKHTLVELIRDWARIAT